MAPTSFQMICELKMYSASAAEAKKTFKLNAAQKACMQDMAARAQSRAPEQPESPAPNGFVLRNILEARGKLNGAPMKTGGRNSIDSQNTRKRPVPDGQESPTGFKKNNCTKLNDVYVF
eukprot:758080-Hanusia_phi.AAC.10